MIEFKIGDDHVPKITLCGNVTTIIADSGMFINSVYNALLTASEESAETFKDIFPVTLLASAAIIFHKNKIKSGSSCTIIVPRKGDGGNGNP